MRPGRLAEGTVCYTAFIGLPGRRFISFAEFGTLRARVFGLRPKIPVFHAFPELDHTMRFPLWRQQISGINLFLLLPICSPRHHSMIELTRFNGSRFVVNSDLVQYAEAAPDTTLTLLNGEKIVVRESLQEMIQLALDYRASLIAQAAKLCPGGILFPTAAALGTASVAMDEYDTARYASRRRAENL